MPKSVSFDVIGTCFAFDTVIEAIQQRLGHHLSAANPPVDAKTLFFSWFYAAQRDFTYLSLASSYTPIARVLSQTFPRACYIVDIPKGSVTQADVDAVMAAFASMAARPGLKACFDGLADAGWSVLAVTNGGRETTKKYYSQAKIALDDDNLVSCDEYKVAKPDPKVYEAARERAGQLVAKGGEKESERWFVAAHSWDLIAAKKAGFKTAWLAFEERDRVEGIFGEFDLVAADMQELLQKLKAV